MKRFIYFILGLIGFISALGTVGAGDAEIIGLNQLVIQSLISAVLLLISIFGLNLEEKRDKHRRKKDGSGKDF